MSVSSLEQACASFAEGSDAVRQRLESGGYSAAVRKMLGHDVTEAQAPAKKQRTLKVPEGFLEEVRL